jgi:hypothetical protein
MQVAGNPPSPVEPSFEAQDSAIRNTGEAAADYSVVEPMRYCPVCSQRLESRRCKLICNICGYYMSCADYY